MNTLKKDWKPDLGIQHILLTVKCLLIVPNAESALNEEAGKLLLEHYDDYCSRAKLYTEIHAQSEPKTSSSDGGQGGSGSEEVPSKKVASGSAALNAEKKKKEKSLKESKKKLKRL